MSDTDAQVPLPDLNAADAPPIDDLAYNEDEQASRIAADLEAVFDVPVQVSAVLGRSKMDVGELLKLGPGTVLELDRRVGEAIDIYVNNRLVARGEVVLAEPGMAAGDCRIEWADGGVKRDLAATESAIDVAVARYVAGRRGEAYLPETSWRDER